MTKESHTVQEMIYDKSLTREVSRPNSFIFNIYGDIVTRRPGEQRVALAGLVRLMDPFGVSEAAVRQSVSRLARQGWLRAERSGNRAYYAVTDRGRRRIEELSPRIYGPLVDWDGHWRMLVYSIDERRRDRRDRLRKELAVLGWAPLATATWISPNGDLAAVAAAATEAEASGDIAIFESSHRGPGSDAALVARCWNLPAIAAAYERFTELYRPRLNAERSARTFGERDAFVERLWLVHDYRKFTYVDPALPSVLLPAHWPGSTAAAIFREYYALLYDRSNRFFDRNAGP